MLIPLDTHSRDFGVHSMEAKFMARQSKVFFDNYGFPMKIGYFSSSASSLLHFSRGNVPFNLEKAFSMMVSLNPKRMDTAGNVMMQFIDNTNRVVLQLSYYQSKVKLR